MFTCMYDFADRYISARMMKHNKFVLCGNRFLRALVKRKSSFEFGNNRSYFTNTRIFFGFKQTLKSPFLGL